MRFGLVDDRPRTLDEMADFFGLTKERIRQIERMAIAKIRLDRNGVLGDEVEQYSVKISPDGEDA